jgi:hypothetical protein
VRCGILHQGETTLGWQIRREGDMLEEDDEGRRVINAFAFVRKLKLAVEAYCDELLVAEWSDETWVLCRKKMNSICLNCAL